MKKIVVGVIIMAFGALLLLSKMNVFFFDLPDYVFSWQTLLIVIGVIMLFARSSDNQGTGIVLVAVGSLFLLPKIFHNISVGDIIFPVAIIAIGIALVIRAATGKKIEKYFYKRSEWKNEVNDFKIDSNGAIRKEYVFTGSKEKWTQGKLKNVEIEAAFSSVEIDFTQAELAGDVKVAARISVKSVFSTAILYVPEDWNITIQKTGIFGGFTDNRPNRVLQIASDKLVILELEAVFGGGEIRCYE